jgi:hypothetical protein
LWVFELPVSCSQDRFHSIFHSLLSTFF